VSGLVTVGLPVYNGGRYIEEALRSLLAQDYEEIEFLIADNASTDRTVDACRDVANGDSRVRIIRSDRNRGASWNYNRLLEDVRGPYFKWAAADDVCAPSFVSACVRALEHDGPGAVIAFPRSDLIDEDSNFISAVDDTHLALPEPQPSVRIGRLLRNRFEWHPVFGVMRLDSLRQTGLMGSYVIADVVLLVELAMLGRFLQVPETLFLRRYHAERPLIAQPRFRDQAAWFDPERGRGGRMPQANVARELVRAVLRSGLPAPEQARCLAAAARSWIVPHWRHIGGEAKLVAREELGRWVRR